LTWFVGLVQGVVGFGIDSTPNTLTPGPGVHFLLIFLEIRQIAQWVLVKCQVR